MRSLLLALTFLTSFIISATSHAAFCGSDGYLHGWVGSNQIPCTPPPPPTSK